MILAVNYSKTPMIYHKTINNKVQTMVKFGEKANNLSWNVTNGFMAGTMGAMFDTLQSKLANNGRDQKVKFYWDYSRGGAVSALSNEAMSAYKTLVGGKKADIARTALEQWVQKALEAQKEDEKNYGLSLIHI